MQLFYGTEGLAIMMNSKGPALPPQSKDKKKYEIKPSPKGTAADSDLHKNPIPTLRPVKTEDKPPLVPPNGKTE